MMHRKTSSDPKKLEQDKKSNYFHQLLFGRSTLAPNVKSFLKSHGDKRIVKMDIVRTPWNAVF